MSAQRMLVRVFELGVMFLVPSIVWATLVAGLVQLVRKGLNRLHIVPQSFRSLARKSVR